MLAARIYMIRARVVASMSLPLAAESWILSILGWVWLVVQEMGAWSLLSAHIVYGLLVVSTVHLISTAVCPDSRQLKRAFFGSVLALTLFGVSCIVDTFYSNTIWGTRYKALPGAGCCSNCDNAKLNRVLFFTDSRLYLIQAGACMGYLLVQLILAAVPVLDQENRTLWPGPAFGTALAILLSARMTILTDGSTVGLVPLGSIYILLFSMPLIRLSFVYMAVGLALTLLMGVEGISGLQRTGLKITRCITLGVLLFFAGGSAVVLNERGMLTAGISLALVLTLPAAVYGVVEAFLAQETGLGGRLQAHSVGGVSRYYMPIPVQAGGEKKGV